ncbi:toprim domain-containing protein [Spiroplasma endosymbiont of Aspidapion aeneum]|uniref:toprim domain-containing protein n=1 Tax=Spiroplasma endosymbiont of Aspidapion aeneum TaxID=3066276 RepID=UPI00313B950B
MNKDNDFFGALKTISKSNSANLFFDLIENKDKINDIRNILNDIELNFTICNICLYIKNNNLCFFCDEKDRDISKICVVSSLFDAYKIYNTKYNGQIHILNTKIEFQNPNDYTIEKLRKRLYNIKELIIALNLTFEGEVISNYLKNILAKEVNKISRIAQGIPFGGSLNYADYETLSSAILNRKKINKG